MADIRTDIEEIIGIEKFTGQGSFLEGLSSDTQIEDKVFFLKSTFDAWDDNSVEMDEGLLGLIKENRLSAGAAAYFLAMYNPYNIWAKKSLAREYEKMGSECLHTFNIAFYFFRHKDLEQKTGKLESSNFVGKEMPEGYIGTEAHAIDYEKWMYEVILSHMVVLKGKVGEISALLAGGKQNYGAIQKLVDDNSSNFANDDSTSEIVDIINIYKAEKAANRRKCFLDISNDLNNLLTLYRKMKYMMFRVEFDKFDDKGNELCDTIRDYCLSPEAIDCMVTNFCYNHFETYFKLAKVFICHNMYDFAERMLKTCTKLRPEVDSIQSLLKKVSDMRERISG